ncbi:MAG: hypothetical protein OJF50_006444 [Nitrospira sp.]|jgi:putative effector of murein hydrolase LrgA (UPF0299 family)|nr:hypothetical protein [Nitrospira sp.]
MRDANGIYGKGTAGPLFPSSTPRPKPKSLLEAISDIEKLSAVERTGNPIPEHFLLLNEKIAYFDVGLKGGWADALVTLFLVPLSMGVIDHVVPIFGSSNPSVMDQTFSMLIGVSYMLGYNILMAFNLGRCLFGPVCRHAIWQLYGGFVAGSVLKMLLVFFLYHFLYVKFTPEFLSHLMTSAYPAARPFVSLDQWDTAFYWLVSMRDSLFKSGVFVVFSTVLCFAIPGVSFVIGSANAQREARLKREYDGF